MCVCLLCFVKGWVGILGVRWENAGERRLLGCLLAFLDISVSPVGVSVQHSHVWSPWLSEEGVGSSGTGVIDGDGALCGCWQSNLGPVQEQMLLTAWGQFIASQKPTFGLEGRAQLSTCCCVLNRVGLAINAVGVSLIFLLLCNELLQIQQLKAHGPSTQISLDYGQGCFVELGSSSMCSCAC